MEQTNVDPLVVGGGIAGLVAAARAAELSARVTVLERGEGLYRCNARIAGGGFHACFRTDVLDDPKALLDVILAEVPSASPALAEAVAATAAQVIDWLQRQGVQIAQVGTDACRDLGAISRAAE